MPCFSRSPPGDRSRCFPGRSCVRKYRRARWLAGSPRCSVVTPRFRDRRALRVAGRLAGRLSLLNPQAAVSVGSRRVTHRAGCPACSNTAGRGERLLPDRDNFSLAVTYFPVFWSLSPTALRSMQVRTHDKTSLVTIGAALGVAAGLALTGCSGAASAAGGGHASSGASRTAGTSATQDTAAAAPSAQPTPTPTSPGTAAPSASPTATAAAAGAPSAVASPRPVGAGSATPVPVPTRRPAARGYLRAEPRAEPASRQGGLAVLPRRGHAGSLTHQGREDADGAQSCPVPLGRRRKKAGGPGVSRTRSDDPSFSLWACTRTRGPGASADRKRGGCPIRRSAGRSR